MSEQLKAWPLGGYAPGDYFCRCIHCAVEFTGDKRALQCLPCAVNSLKRRAEAAEARVTKLEGLLDRAREGLETYAEFHKRVTEQLGVAVHTGLRKGSDGPGAHTAWKAINDCNKGEWSEAISYAVFGLTYGLEKQIAAARDTLTALSGGDLESARAHPSADAGAHIPRSPEAPHDDGEGA